jgi:hypothetical protein
MAVRGGGRPPHREPLPTDISGPSVTPTYNGGKKVAYSGGRTCPACHAEFEPNRIGRPKRFCSDACRREFTKLRAEIPILEDELAEARQHAKNNYGGRAY